jgi:hypothetical protein
MAKSSMTTEIIALAGVAEARHLQVLPHDPNAASGEPASAHLDVYHIVASFERIGNFLGLGMRKV